MIIENTLFDIKCTSGKDTIYEILQLLGYLSLINFNKNMKKIENISVINLLQGNIKTYDITHIKNDELLKYLKILIE
jgi:hypothetical protein